MNATTIAEPVDDRITRVAVMRQQGKSHAVIADVLGVSKGLVAGLIRIAARAGFDVDPPDGKVVSLDGRWRPVARTPAKPPKAVAVDPLVRKAAEPVAEIVMDYLYRPAKGETAEAGLLACMVQAVRRSGVSPSAVLALCLEDRWGGPCAKMPSLAQLPLDRLRNWFERRRAEILKVPPPGAKTPKRGHGLPKPAAPRHATQKCRAE